MCLSSEIWKLIREQTRLTNVLVTLQTKAKNKSPEPESPAVALIDAHAAGAAAGQIQFSGYTKSRTEILLSVQESSSVQIRPQLLKKMPRWLFVFVRAA